MALTSNQLDEVVSNVVGMYEDAERVALGRIARALERGAESPAWAEEKLLEVQGVLSRVRRDLRDLDVRTESAVLSAITAAYQKGAGPAAGGVLAAVRGPSGRPRLSAAALALAAETASGLRAGHAQILRSVGDVWREVVAKASGVQLTGAATRREAASEALARLADRGLTMFVDRSGRRWQARSYVDMAMRTAAHQASEVGFTDRMVDSGRDLVIVSDHKGECPDCRKFEGKVLSISGAYVPREGDPPVDVFASLAQAKAAGYGHPGCRHRLVAFVPGVTEVPEKQGTPEDYEQRQTQRALERNVRKWRTREVVALTDADRARARAKARAWSGQLRAYESEHGLKHQAHRLSVAPGKPLPRGGLADTIAVR